MEEKGVIYKITNLINNKVYIGQTRQNYKDRFIQHKSHARTGLSNHKLANAFRKYGDKNFIIEPIEYCDYDELNEREIYWIEYYNSIEEGYNILLGQSLGANTYYKLKNEQEIIDFYYKCHNQIETIKHFGITEYKFRQILSKNNLPTDMTNYGKHKRKKVKIVELNKDFDSEVECSQYFIDNNICKTKNIKCVKVKIADAVANNKTYYGYHIIEIL